MLTCAQLGEAVGVAAVHAVHEKAEIRKLISRELIQSIQQALQINDHHIHALDIALPNDIAPFAHVSASSVFSGDLEMKTWGTERLSGSRMQLLSIVSDHIDSVELNVSASASTQLNYSFYQGPESTSTYPDSLLFTGVVEINEGDDQWITIPLSCTIHRKGWHFLIFEDNPAILLHVTEAPPGQLRYYPRPEDPIRPNPYSKWTLRSLAIGQHKAADADGAKVMAPTWSEYALQFKDMSCFLGFSYMCRTSPSQPIYHPSQIINSNSRPTNTPNLWVSTKTNFENPEWVELEWDQSFAIMGIQLLFDSSLHFHFGQSWQGYQTNAIPYIIKKYKDHLEDFYHIFPPQSGYACRYCPFTSICDYYANKEV